MLTTEEIMGLALKLAGLKKVPEDSAVYVKGTGIRKVLFGIDAGPAELLMAKQSGYDAVIAHHPVGGTAVIEFYKVFQRHVQQMVEAGVPESVAERAVQRKLEELEVDAHMRNYSHAVDVATALKMPYMNIHTPLDEVGRQRMILQVNKALKKNATVKEVVSSLYELGEFKNAVTRIRVRVGEPDDPAGKVVVSHGAGTNGGYDIAKAYYEHGANTLIYIHIGARDLERLKAEKLGNLVITGHIASDSVGINPFINELEKRGVSVTRIGIVPA